MNASPSSPFAPDFAWGVATASYQIEGAHDVEGRGLGNWDLFCRKAGAIYQGHTGNRACDHYHRLEEDLDLLSELGVSAYRFGVSWPRILPAGTGKANEAGLAYYDRLVDGLLAREITPYLTLFHWDYPQELERRGGWRNPASPLWFEEFTRVIAQRLGDRVRHWFTLNEPHAYIEGGLKQGRHAPGLTLPQADVLLAAHHTLLAHGRATQVLRAEVRDAWIAMAPVLICAVPKTNGAEDVEAARKFTFSMFGPDLRVTSFWMDPVFGRGYPEETTRLFGRDMPKVAPQDLDLIAQPLDAVGFNLYDAQVVEAGPDGAPVTCPAAPGAPRTAFNWPLTPEAHEYGPRFCHERYGKPIVITENGISCRDFIHLDGQVPDDDRIDFIRTHVDALGRAAESNVPIQGYFHWSLLDNFEWNHGYRERFGLVHVDYQTMTRTKKKSFYAYRDLIRSHRGR